MGYYTDENKKEYLVRIKNIRDFLMIERRIVKEASYSEEGHYRITNPDEVKRAIQEIEKYGIYYQDSNSSLSYLPRPVLIDGSPMYVDVDNIAIQESIFGPVVDFDAKKKVAPELAKRVDHFLYSPFNGIVVDEFLAYKNHEELIPIETKIERLHGLLDLTREERDKEGSDEYLDELEKLQTALKNGWYFDTKLLMKYYMEAGSLVELQDKANRRVLTLNQL